MLGENEALTRLYEVIERSICADFVGNGERSGVGKFY